jgi:preprotein translocase subunit SecA
MTGTAITEAEEFGKIYGLDTYAIPTNKPIARLDKNDAIYKNIRGKYAAVVETVKELHQKGQPVLVGTVSIEKSELISSALQKAQIPHNVLNAKQHEKEAEIIARAGEKGAVTIATNMAGRGTDIKVGEEVKTLGGLYVIGTERHESRRIDNQLRGRSGRQGDPGASQFFISMEDDLMRLFGADRIRRFMEFANIPDDMPIENKMISRTVENAQKKVEGHHFDTRKHVVEYDDVMNAQREIIYARRRKILEAENLKNEIVIAIEQEVEKIVLFHTNDPDNNKWNYQEIFENINSIHKDQVTPLALAQIQQITNQEDLIDKIKHHLLREYTEKESLLPTPEIMRQLEKQVYLRVIDTLWMEHIDQLSYLRDRVSLMGYGQRDPLIAYKQEAFDMFEKLIGTIQSNLVNTLFKVKLVAEPIKTETEQSPNHQITSKKTHLDPSLINKKTGPNEECPCGSGKKFKKCHG